MIKHLFFGKNDLDEQGNRKRDENGAPVLPPCFIESDNKKTTLQGLNKVRQDLGREPIEDETSCEEGIDLSGSCWGSMIVRRGGEYHIVPFDPALKPFPAVSEEDDFDKPGTLTGTSPPSTIEEAGSGERNNPMGEAEKSEIIIDPEFQELFPPLSKDAYEKLKESILIGGCRDSLVVWLITTDQISTRRPHVHSLTTEM